MLPALAHTVQVEHRYEGESGAPILSNINSTTTDRQIATSHSNTPSVRNRAPAPLTDRSSSVRCVSAAEHHTTEQFFKTGGQNPESISQEVIYLLTKVQLKNLYFNSRLFAAFALSQPNLLLSNHFSSGSKTN